MPKDFNLLQNELHQDKIIEHVNKLNLTWKADHCKLSKHHPHHDPHCKAKKAAAKNAIHQKEANHKPSEAKHVLKTKGDEKQVNTTSHV